MKKLLKQQLLVEGKRSQVARSNMQETNKVTAAIIAASYALKDDTYVKERTSYESKMLNKAMNKLDKKAMSFDELVKYLLGRK